MPRKTMTDQAEKYMHGTCRHLNEKGEVIWIDANGIIQESMTRKPDRFETAALTEFGKLCFANAFPTSRR